MLTRSPGRSRLSVAAGAVLAVISALTIAHWAVLVLHFPDLSELKGWCWIVHPKPTGAPWLILLLIAVPSAILYYLVRRSPPASTFSESHVAPTPQWIAAPAGATVPEQRRLHPAIGLALLIGLGSFLQFGFVGLEGRGIAALREKMVDSDYHEFAALAVQEDSLLRVVSNYDSLVDRGALGQLPQSKPPGQLLLYMLTERLANLGDIDQPRGFRLRRLETLATYLWPVLSTLVLIPLFFLTRSLFDERRAMVACALCAFVPSMNLIVLLADQVFFPTFFLTAVLLSATAVRRNSLAWSFAAGTVIYLAIFCSFGLVFAIPVALGVCFALCFDPETGKIDIRRFIRISTCIVISALLVDGVFRVAFGYDVVLRYQKAVLFHLRWKTWVPGSENVVYYGSLNLLEFAVWLGLPLTLLAWLHCGRAMLSAAIPNYGNSSPKRGARIARRDDRECREYSRKEQRREAGCPARNTWSYLGIGALRTVRLRVDRAALLSWTVFGAVLALAYLGQTKNEVARLWLFMVPLFCVLAADEIETRFRESGNMPLVLVALLQGGTVYVTKIMQDFY